MLVENPQSEKERLLGTLVLEEKAMLRTIRPLKKKGDNTFLRNISRSKG